MKKESESKLKFFSWKEKKISERLFRGKKYRYWLFVFLETLTELSMLLEDFIYLC